MGEIIHGFELLKPLENRDAGFSMWTFARRNGKDYFLKKYMTPVYPEEGIMAKTQWEEAVRSCHAYEEKQTRLYDTINRASDGNVVRVDAFFRDLTNYYIVMERIRNENITCRDIFNSPPVERLRLCRIISHSVARLHAAGVVHADLKDKNILICRTPAGRYSAKIIDFDCGFLQDSPPGEDEDIGGDQVYTAPEVCRFIAGESVPLTTKIDVFSLGILFHQYLAGELPGFDTTEYYYLHESVLDGHPAVISENIPEKYRMILSKMLEKEAEDRCTAQEVCDWLKPASLRRSDPVPAPDPGSFFMRAPDLT
ncbi:MAG: protein kinase [Eubacteriales bacterium]|nr:protein kinase [Eubacteriales bacterium]